jgi:hypothetical protein
MIETKTRPIHGKPWKCIKCNHILGYMIKDGPFDRLKVCTIGPVQVIITGEGKVFCPICDEPKIWIPGEEVMKQMIRRFLLTGAQVFMIDKP